MIEKEKGAHELTLSIELTDDDIQTLSRYGKIRNNNPNHTEKNLKGYCEILLGGAIEDLERKYYQEEIEEFDPNIKKIRETQKNLRRVADELENAVVANDKVDKEATCNAIVKCLVHMIKAFGLAE